MSQLTRLLLRAATSLVSRVLLVAVTTFTLLWGCKSSEPQKNVEESELVVFAATSLRDVFAGMGKGFEAAHPGTTVTFNFAGTQELCTQLQNGAKGDVFASADQKHVDALVAASLVVAPRVFARNEPVLVVSTEARERIQDLAQLPEAANIVIGAPEVPIGRYTLQILDNASAKLGADFRAKVEAKVVSRELNVRQVLTRVSLGEAEAGVVYRTDVGASQGKVTVVTIPKDVNVIAEYPIAEVAAAEHPHVARAWLEFVFSDPGQAALRDAGFNAPAGSVSSK
jgi:molybdate transport system substrate-binding protein